jgi:hypothetical protein
VSPFILKPDHKNKKPRHESINPPKIHGNNFFNIKLFDSTNIKCQNGPVLTPGQVFYFNGQALHLERRKERNKIHLFVTKQNIIISLLMPPLLGHGPSLWINHKENGP